MCGPPDYREVQLESRFEGSGFEVCERESDQPREFPRPALRMSTRASSPRVVFPAVRLPDSFAAVCATRLRWHWAIRPALRSALTSRPAGNSPEVRSIRFGRSARQPATLDVPDRSQQNVAKLQSVRS